MKTLQTFLKEASGDRVGTPVKPLKGHTSEQTAFVVDEYPYGFNARTKIRYWLEYKKGKGFRFVSQTMNPKTSKWNSAKPSTYSEFCGFMYQDSKDYVGWMALNQYSSLTEAKDFLHKYEKFMDKVALDMIKYVIAEKEKRGLS